MSLNREVIEKNLDYIRETTKTNRNEFLIAFFLYEINETKKEELTEDMINSIYHILEESEYYYDEELRDNIRSIKTKTDKTQFKDLLNNYIDKCTEEEWKLLLNNYNIKDTENYIGEVRNNIEKAVIEEYEDADQDLKNDLFYFFYNSLRPSIARARVTSSAYSKSAPTGSPKAIREIFIPKGLINFVKYKLVASPSTEGERAKITSWTSSFVSLCNNSLILISSAPIPSIGEIRPCNT